MTDDATDYEELLPDHHQRHREWFWMFAGSSVGAMCSGAAVLWAGVPAWGNIATGAVMYLCCLAVRQYYRI